MLNTQIIYGLHDFFAFIELLGKDVRKPDELEI